MEARKDISLGCLLRKWEPLAMMIRSQDSDLRESSTSVTITSKSSRSELEIIIQLPFQKMGISIPGEKASMEL